jgi:integrase
MTKPAALLKGFEKEVANAKPGAKRRVIFDQATTGLALVISPKGKKSFSVVARDPSGKQVWKRLGDPGGMSVAEARAAATSAVERVKAGSAPVAPSEPVKAPETFREVSERFLTRWVERGGKKQDGAPLRSAGEIRRQFKAYLYPRWEATPFLSIRRGTVTELLDDLADNNGPVQADRVLATLSRLFGWYRQYDEDYVSPVIPEMRRSGSTADRSRARVLTDEEIRTLWSTSEGTFGALVKVALLTGQRRAKLAKMQWTDVQHGIWTIAAEAREKVNAGKLPLPKLALDVIEAQPKIDGNPYVFAGRGNKAFNSFSACKADLSKRTAIAPWVLHDLRRTARSLMARAGVRPDVAERTLGHVIAGVEGTYDRHSYTREKGEALEALAALIERILEGKTDNVVPIKGAVR